MKNSPGGCRWDVFSHGICGHFFLEMPNQVISKMCLNYIPRWWELKYFLFSTLPGEMIPNLTFAYFSHGREKTTN